MYRPAEGVIKVDGQPLHGTDPASWATVSAGTFQDFAKPQLYAFEAIGIGDLSRLDDRDAVDTAAAQAGAAAILAALPQGLHTRLGRLFGGVELSHGQWQKFALGRALMRPTPLLRIFDEPTAALDPEAEHELFTRIAASSREAAGSGCVTLLVSHRFSTVQLADHILVLADGTIAERGTHAELLAAGGVYAQLYTAQARAYR
jgi:ATP-binding cassette, subfamily B, bacterial